MPRPTVGSADTGRQHTDLTKETVELAVLDEGSPESIFSLIFSAEEAEEGGK